MRFLFTLAYPEWAPGGADGAAQPRPHGARHEVTIWTDGKRPGDLHERL